VNIFPNSKLTKIDNFCPLLAIWPNEKTIVTKGGKFARVIEMTGKDYSGLAPEIIESLYETRKGFFEGLSSEITVMQQSHRVIVTRAKQKITETTDMAGEIGHIWNEQFTKSFRTKHFLIFVTDPDVKDQLQLLVKQRDKDETRQDELLRSLEDSVKDIFVRLQDYGPKELKNDELASYWAWMVNGKQVYQKAPQNGLLDGLLSGVSLKWPKNKRYQIYDGSQDRFSGWLYIKSPANASNQGLLDKLFQLKEELSIYQTFSNVEKNEALSFAEDKLKNVGVFSKSPEIIQMEMMELSSRIQADEITLMSHRWSIEIYGNSVEQLENSISVVSNAIESYGYRTARERVNQEALFWARFPEYQTFNCRQRFPTSETASHLCTFATVGEGYDKCSWGDSPVTVFKTPADSEYSFIFHISPEKTVLGNTLIIGGTGAGKTTFISFLLSQCFKFPDFRVLAFDRLKGMKIFTHMHDGVYQDFEKGLSINPLQLDDTTENRTFLSQWFQVLTGKTDDKSVDTISQAIIQIFELEKSSRTLANSGDAFGLKEDGTIRKALEKWLPGGGWEGYFNGTKDALNFVNPLVTFDMTTLLGSPDILGPMTYYLFHKLFLTAREQGGYAVFVDELGKYLDSETFAPKIDMMLEEIRKTNGVFIGAVQDAGSVLNHKVAAKIKNNIGTYILFPEPRAERSHYINELRLNETEFEWIKKPHPREVMIKRKDGESVILNVDLKPLNRYLQVFDSSSDSIDRLNKLRSKTNDWKTRFIHGERRNNRANDGLT
jgi:type IV secretion/conjugal transfer VirB4 family ATPase